MLGGGVGAHWVLGEASILPQCSGNARFELQIGNIPHGQEDYVYLYCLLFLGWQLLSNYLVIPVVTVFCPKILVTLLTFDTVTGQISKSKWKVTSK